MSRPLATRHEWLWVIAVLAGAALVGLLPYWVGYRSQTPEWVFSGALWDRMDYSVHIGTMWLGQQGDWAYRFRFTAEPQPGSYVKSFYILLGHAARWSGLSLEVVYHVGRVVFGMLSGLAAYAWLALTFFFIIPFAALLFRKIKQNRALLGAVCLLVIGGIFLARFVEIAPALLPQPPGAGTAALIPVLLSSGSVLLAGLGAGLWLYNWFLTQVPVLPVGDEIFRSELAGGGEAHS